MCPWPWQNDSQECKHLIKYDGKRIEVSGISFQGFELGKASIEPTLLQAVSHALMLLDASQFHLCEAVKGAPDEETRKKYYDVMMNDKIRGQDIIMGLAVLTLNPESKQVEDALTKMLLQNHNRALELEGEKVAIQQELTEVSSPNSIEIGENKFQAKVTEIEKSLPSRAEEFKKINTQPVKEIDHIGLFHLLNDKFNKEEIKTISFEFKIDYDDLAGDSKQAKARELILYLKRRDKLDGFYNFLIDYLTKRG